MKTEKKMFDCPFCGAPKRIDDKAKSFWVNMMVRLGMNEHFSQRTINSIRKKRGEPA